MRNHVHDSTSISLKFYVSCRDSMLFHNVMYKVSPQEMSTHLPETAAEVGGWKAAKCNPESYRMNWRFISGRTSDDEK